MTKIDGDYLVTDDESVKVLFIGKCLWYWNPAKKNRERLSKHVTMGDLSYASGLKCFISRDVVREAIEPVEGEAAFYWYEEDNEWCDTGLYYQSSCRWELINVSTAKHAQCNAITIGKTVGELRELIEWARGEK